MLATLPARTDTSIASCLRKPQPLSPKDRRRTTASAPGRSFACQLAMCGTCTVNSNALVLARRMLSSPSGDWLLNSRGPQKPCVVRVVSSSAISTSPRWIKPNRLPAGATNAVFTSLFVVYPRKLGSQRDVSEETTAVSYPARRSCSTSQHMAIKPLLQNRTITQ